VHRWVAARRGARAGTPCRYRAPPRSRPPPMTHRAHAAPAARPPRTWLGDAWASQVVAGTRGSSGRGMGGRVTRRTREARPLGQPGRAAAKARKDVLRRGVALPLLWGEAVHPETIAVRGRAAGDGVGAGGKGAQHGPEHGGRGAAGPTPLVAGRNEWAGTRGGTSSGLCRACAAGSERTRKSEAARVARLQR
jgi:hypothetical protein